MRLPELEFKPTVPVLLARASQTYGDADYVVSADRRLSFAEAHERSGELARHLVAAGVGKGSKVGVMLPSGTDWVIVWLALARIGAISMLFSTTYRSMEIAKSLRYGDVELFIAPAELMGRDLATEIETALPGLADQSPGSYRLTAAPYLRDIWLVGGTDQPWATPVTVDPLSTPIDASDISDELLAAIEEQVHPADVLTVIYTSGSSAEPKAVMHTQGVAVRKVSPEVGLGLWNSQPGRVLMAMPFFWVGGPQSALGALHVGSTILCQERLEPGGALDLMEREKATTVGGWPASLEAIRQHPSYESRDLSSMVTPDPPPPPGTPGATVLESGSRCERRNDRNLRTPPQPRAVRLQGHRPRDRRDPPDRGGG